MRHQHQMYMRFPTLYDGRNEKGQTCEGLSSERPKNRQDKVLKDKKAIDKMKKGQNKMTHYFCHQCVIFWEKCKNSHKFIRRVQYHLKLSFLQGIYGLWQKEKFHQKKIEGVPIRRSRPVPLKVVWMGFEPLINVLKCLISNQSNSEGWVANDGKFIPNVLLRNKSIL